MSPRYVMAFWTQHPAMSQKWCKQLHIKLCSRQLQCKKPHIRTN